MNYEIKVVSLGNNLFTFSLSYDGGPEYDVTKPLIWLAGAYPIVKGDKLFEGTTFKKFIERSNASVIIQCLEIPTKDLYDKVIATIKEVVATPLFQMESSKDLVSLQSIHDALED